MTQPPFAILDEIYEVYMAAPESGQHEAYCVARDIFRLIGFIEGMRAAQNPPTEKSND